MRSPSTERSVFPRISARFRACSWPTLSSLPSGFLEGGVGQSSFESMAADPRSSWTAAKAVRTESPQDSSRRHPAGRTQARQARPGWTLHRRRFPARSHRAAPDRSAAPQAEHTDSMLISFRSPASALGPTDPRRALANTSFGAVDSQGSASSKGYASRLADNLALLCHHHHFLKTYEGWDLARAGTRPDGTPEWSFCPPVPFGQEPGLGIDTPEGRRDLHQDE